jgi:hypothetical protein
LSPKRALEAFLWRNQCAALSHLHNRKRVAEFVTSGMRPEPPAECVPNYTKIQGPFWTYLK